MKVLVTGFAPFGGAEMNPSWEAVRRMEAPPGVELDRLELPVSFADAGSALTRRLLENRPDAIVLVGQAGGREGISIERLALNLADASIPDNQGRQPVDEVVDPSGPAAIFSTAPVKKILDALKEAGLPAGISLSAGTFVCNHVYYTALRAVQQHMFPTRVVFIHVPYASGQEADPSAPSMPLHKIVRAVEIVAGTV